MFINTLNRFESPLLVVLDQFTSTRSVEATAATVTRQSHNTDRGRMNQGEITTVDDKPELEFPETNSQLGPWKIGLNAPQKEMEIHLPSSISRCKPAKVSFRVPGIFRRCFFGVEKGGCLQQLFGWLGGWAPQDL